MKSKYFLIFSIIIVLFTITSCDSANEAREWKEKYDELNKKYIALELQYKELKENGRKYMKNTKKMLQDD